MSLITSLFTVGSGGSTGRSWCRPTHRTNCIYVTGGNTCCICIPASASCFVIEMWGQGGGGAGVCCCMGACFGGQGGDYAWVTCQTSAQVHTMCMCVCQCNCCNCNAGLWTGSPGQGASVCDCTLAIGYLVAASACGGSTCCNGIQGMDSPAPAQIGGNPERNVAHSNNAINCCCFGNWTNSWCYDSCSYEYISNGKNPFSIGSQMPFAQIQGTTSYNVSCACCTRFNFYVRGGCGWNAPSILTQYATDQANWYQIPSNTYCGAGYGRGGSSYAGGMGQCCDCGSGGAGSRYFGGVNGNAPGGGGSSASMGYSPGSCCIGSCGGQGLILISWS